MEDNYDIAKHQIEMQEKIQIAGFNVVTCGNCGHVLLHDVDDSKIDCFCGHEMDLIDCPDLWYRGAENKYI